MRRLRLDHSQIGCLLQVPELRFDDRMQLMRQPAASSRSRIKELDWPVGRPAEVFATLLNRSQTTSPAVSSASTYPLKQTLSSPNRGPESSVPS
jgi:hypothetical protein